MVLTETPVCDFDWEAPDFSLCDPDGKEYSLEDLMGPGGLLIAFICNHCPYVQDIIARLVKDARELQDNGIGVVAIMPNDYRDYDEDSPENMKRFARRHRFSFPYLVDESQQVARDYGAECTPDFFGLNAEGLLQYRGRLDDGRPGRRKTGGRELLEAMLQIADTGEGPREQSPSMGCSIKW